jgi:signal peptidase
MGPFRTLLRMAATCFASVAVTAVGVYAVLLGLGYKPVAVYSGSMVPTLRVGGVAFDRSVPSSSVRVGDVITFSDPYTPGRLVTHRVVRIFHTKQGTAYRTKGDANATRDPWTIRLGARVGRVSFSVPYAGYVLWYSRTREIRTALLLLTSLLTLTAVLRRIWRPSGAAVNA